MSDRPQICRHEERLQARRSKQDGLEFFVADSIAGQYDVHWCSYCGAIKIGAQDWRWPSGARGPKLPLF